MDSLTQATLGAAIGEFILGKKLGRKGAFLGAGIATIPDLDVLLLPFLGPLERLSMHRGYSHSILFSVLGALFLAYLFRYWRLTKEISFVRLFLFSWLCLFTHMLLDAFTTYGTLLFLPFSDMRVSFDSINVVDPFYTVPLLIGILVALFYNKNNAIKKYANTTGVIISSCYLIFTLFIKADVKHKFEQLFIDQNIEVSKTSIYPVGLGSLHWYGIGRTAEGFHLGLFEYEMEQNINLEYFTSDDSLIQNVDPYTVDRMKWFAKDNYHIAVEGDTIYFYNMQVDMQGIYNLRNRKAPTRGFFMLENKANGKVIGSSRHK